MRASYRMRGVDGEWQRTALVAAGLGLGAVGGFVGSLWRRHPARAAARVRAAVVFPVSRRHGMRA